MASQDNLHWMVRNDMDQVVEIERLAFEFPWLRSDFIRCLLQRNVVGMVYLAPPKTPRDKTRFVYGYMIYELHQTRLHVLNFAVHPDFRRLGVGRAMVDKLTGKLNQQRRVRITLEVRERNLDAQLFFSEMGFKAVTVLRDYYEDSEEDAYLFQLRITDASEVLA